jgi:uncharacterized protein YjiS (DUF1127 family)
MPTSRSLYRARGVVVAPPPRAWPHQIASLLAMGSWMIFALKRQIAIRQAGAALEGLSDNLLKDIGISRCDIQRVVREGRGALRRPGANRGAASARIGSLPPACVPPRGRSR